MSSELITRNDLENILKESLPSAAVDYIVEQGTSDGWTYRKWNSGKAEAWIRTPLSNYSITTVRGNLYSGDWKTLTYPFTFTGITSVLTSVQLATDAYVIDTQITDVQLTYFKYRVFSGSSISTVITGFYVSAFVMGTWK